MKKKINNNEFCKCGCGEKISKHSLTGYRPNHFWKNKNIRASINKSRIEKIRKKALGRKCSEITKEKQRKNGERKYPINIEYFKKLNIRNAYVLGYLFADGYFKKAKNTGFPRLCVYSTDKELIDKIRNEFGVKNRKNYSKIRAKNSKRKKGYSFRIRSYNFLKYLEPLGMLLGKKAYRIFVPKIIAKNKKIFFSFFRGYFDGDGTINKYLPGKIRHHRYPCIRVYSASRKFLENLKFYLKKYNINSAPIKIRYSLTGSWGVLTFYGKQNTYNLYRSMYKSSDALYLSRKKTKIEEFFKAWGWKIYDGKCSK